MRAEEFLSLIDQRVNGHGELFAFGTIPSNYTSGDPPVTFDGETVVSTKAYTHLSSYTPAANDRVLLARVGASWVVVGKVG